MTTATLTVLGLMLVLFGSCCYLYLTCSTVDNASFATSGSSSWASNGISEGTSGELFRAVHVHTFSGERLFAAWKPPSTPAPGRSPCKMWAVITSIFAPTTTVKQIASLKDWCLVIAGDKKSPREYNVSGERTHYLSPDAQERLPFATSKMLRWNHFGRKNLGYLYTPSSKEHGLGIRHRRRQRASESRVWHPHPATEHIRRGGGHRAPAL